ncbi:butyrophilin-like protein 9 [Lissotriton helveticus]
MMVHPCLPGLFSLLVLCLYHEPPVSGAAVQSVNAVGPSQPICAIVGGETILSCQLDPPISAVEMEVFWETSNRVYLVHLYDNGTEYDDKLDEPYKGRTKMIKKDIAHGGVAVSFTNITRSDARRYMCAFLSTTPDVETFAEFEIQVAGASACDLEKERDTLQVEKDALQKEKGDLIQARDNLQKEKGDLIKARDNLQIEKDTLQKEKDDVTLYVGNPTENLNPLLREFVRFGGLSGISIKWSKSVIFPLTDNTLEVHSDYPLRWEADEVKYLGVWSSRKLQDIWTLNFGRAISWLESDLIKARDTLQKEKDTLQKEKGDLIKARDNLQEEKDTLQKEKVILQQYRDAPEDKKDWRWARTFAAAVTLDPDTASPWLVLSDDGRSVRLGDRAQDLPDTPQRFTKYIIVLGRERLSSGRHYWEVEVGDKTRWSLGVSDEAASRKGNITLAPEFGYWTVWLRDGKYQANTSPPTLLTPQVPPRAVGLFLDYEAGRISFYNADDGSLLFTYSGATFPPTLRPLFNPGLDQGGGNAGALRVLPVTVRG